MWNSKFYGEEDADEAGAAPACGWPRFDAALRALRDAAGEDAAPVARDAAERFAALVRILIAPRTPSEIVASSSTPSTRCLLDGVAMPVPHRSTEPGRPRHRRETG